MTNDQASRDLAWQLGIGSTLAVGALLVAWALTINMTSLQGGFFYDGATYYMYTHSIVDDWDFEYKREDLMRVWEEYTTGPEGLFLKRGRDVQGLSFTATPPFFEIESAPDWDEDRLYYAKAFIYPLAAAPFVWLFGTNGFFVLHALLMTACFACAYGFLVARSAPVPALIFAIAFLFVSVVPAYLVLYMPDFFNLALVLVACFFWCYKEVAAESTTVCLGRWRKRFVVGPWSDVIAAALFGIASYSKPTLVFTALPMLVLFLVRRQWLRGLLTGSVMAAFVIGLFALNVAITGDWNYQGGDRRAFYTTGGGETGGFPFQTPAHLFEKGGFGRATNRVPVEVLVGREALIDVFRRNLGYFFVGRYAGFIPYFFPGAAAAALFLFSRSHKRHLWQWFVLAVALGTGVFLLLYMPFTYSGGGGPIGNRYFLGIYPLLLFVTPPLLRARAALATTAISALFVTPIMMNPVHAAFHPGDHADKGVYRVLPVELTLLNDLPVNVDHWRVKQPLGGKPPVLAYFLDRNTYLMEGESFWVRGKSRADMLLRAPITVEEPSGEGEGKVRPLRITSLDVSLETGAAANRVTVRTDVDSQTIDVPAGNRRSVTLKLPAGVPYKPYPDLPTNYVYFLSVENNSGFVPMFHNTPPRDPRFLGIYVRVTPTYE